MIATFNRIRLQTLSALAGRHSPIPEIRQSGMWLVKGLEERCLDEQEYLNYTVAKPYQLNLRLDNDLAIDASQTKRYHLKSATNEEAFEQAI